jgi:hypothetical protein
LLKALSCTTCVIFRDSHHFDFLSLSYLDMVLFVNSSSDTLFESLFLIKLLVLFLLELFEVINLNLTIETWHFWI